MYTKPHKQTTRTRPHSHIYLYIYINITEELPIVPQAQFLRHTLKTHSTAAFYPHSYRVLSNSMLNVRDDFFSVYRLYSTSVFKSLALNRCDKTKT